MKTLTTILFAMVFGLMYALDKDDDGRHYKCWTYLFGFFVGSAFYQWIKLLIS